MKAIIEMVVERQPAPNDKRERARGIGYRLLWFALFWLGGVASVGAVSLLLRTWIGN